MYKTEKVEKIQLRLESICKRIKEAEESEQISAEELKQLYNEKNELVWLLNYLQ